MTDNVYKAYFARTSDGGMNRTGANFVPMILVGRKVSLFPPSTIYKRLGKAFKTKAEAIAAAQKYMDDRGMSKF